MKTESTSPSLAINNTVLVTILALYCYRLSAKVNICITASCVGPIRNKHRVPIIGIIDRWLDIVEIGWTVVVNGYSSSGRIRRYQTHDKN